jgi:hypothetical protein
MIPKIQKCEIQLFIGFILGSLTNAIHCPRKWTPNNNLDYKNNTYIWRSQQNGHSLPKHKLSKSTHNTTPYNTIDFSKT